MTDHLPVLINEATDALNINPSGIYVDATFGRGGHSQQILNKLDNQGRLIAIDQDPDAIAWAKRHHEKDNRFTIRHQSFAALEGFALESNLSGLVDGILFDLGVSSPQLDEAQRGFSFMRDGPLDMRMDNSQGQTASEWLAYVDEATLITVLREYGEERFARRITLAIIEARKEEMIVTTAQLAKIVANAVPKIEQHKHPATRTFQAIRIYINRELDVLKEALTQSLNVLKVGGRLAVISFHSLEDRIVKRFMRDQARGEELPRGLPVKSGFKNQTMKIVGKAVKASNEEVAGNPRARSAVLRIAEKIA